MSDIFVPRPMLGKFYTSGILYGLDVADNGQLTVDGSNGSVVTILTVPPDPLNVGRSVNLTDEVGVIEVNALNTTQMNEVILTDAWTLALEIYLVNNGNDPNPLYYLAENFDYIKYVGARGTVIGSQEVTVFYGHRGAITIPVQGRGEQMCDFTLGPIDPGIAQVSRTVS